jgi:hypothetical protein
MDFDDGNESGGSAPCKAFLAAAQTGGGEHEERDTEGIAIRNSSPIVLVAPVAYGLNINLLKDVTTTKFCSSANN